jgi:hypothetical protein
MTIVKLSAKNYVHTMHGRGVYGKYAKVHTPHGYGVVDALGSTATKMILSGLGKSSGKHLGTLAGKWIKTKTGSDILGKIAKSAVGGVAGFAGQKVGNAVGHLIGNTIFKGEEGGKRKKSHQKVSVSQLLDQARERIAGAPKPVSQSGQGLLLHY